MKIAVIDNFDSFVYNLIRYLKEAGCEVIVMRNNQINYEDLAHADAILLSPGPGVPIEAGEMMKVISLFYEQKSILGVCLGHQALAEFFNHELIQNPKPIHGESSMIDLLSNDILFKNISSPTMVGRYHSWNVKNNIKRPLICTAISNKDEIMAFRHESLSLYGVQFHPESILTPEGRKMIQNWVELVKTKCINIQAH